jgi:hypothetical protein
MAVSNSYQQKVPRATPRLNYYILETTASIP